MFYVPCLGGVIISSWIVDCVGASCDADSIEFEIKLERELVRVWEFVWESVWVVLDGKDFDKTERRVLSGFSGFENNSSSVVSV